MIMRPPTIHRLPLFMDRELGHHVFMCVEFAYRTRKTTRLHVIPSKMCKIAGPLFDPIVLCDALTLYVMTSCPYIRFARASSPSAGAIVNACPGCAQEPQGAHVHKGRGAGEPLATVHKGGAFADDAFGGCASPIAPQGSPYLSYHSGPPSRRQVVAIARVWRHATGYFGHTRTRARRAS